MYNSVLFYLTQPFTFTYPLACQPSSAVSCWGGSLGRHPRHRHPPFFSLQLLIAVFPISFSAQALCGVPPLVLWSFQH